MKTILGLCILVAACSTSGEVTLKVRFEESSDLFGTTSTVRTMKREWQQYNGSLSFDKRYMTLIDPSDRHFWTISPANGFAQHGSLDGRHVQIMTRDGFIRPDHSGELYGVLVDWDGNYMGKYYLRWAPVLEDGGAGQQ
jgi:hypothetical protein